MWFMDDLSGFQLNTHSFEALNKMLSWQPTTKFHIIARNQFSGAMPTFVMLLGATVHHGDMTALTSVTPIWRGSLLLNNSNQVAILLRGVLIDGVVARAICYLVGYN